LGVAEDRGWRLYTPAGSARAAVASAALGHDRWPVAVDERKHLVGVVVFEIAGDDLVAVKNERER
jgi:hypothetical protein